MLQNFIFYSLFIPTTVFFSVLGSTFKRLGWYSCITWSRWGTKLLGCKVDVDLSALDPKGHYVFMANHSSMTDIPVTTAVLGRYWRTAFLAKKSLFDFPFFGRALIHAGHIPVDRANRRSAMKSVAAAVDLAKGGRNIVVFPDGTRATDLTRLQPFKTGGIIIALKTGLPIVPLVITGTGRVLPKHKLWLSRAVIRVRALPPIVTQGKYTLKQRDQLTQDLYDMMNTAYVEQTNA